MTPLRQRMIAEMRRKGLSRKTEKTYVPAVAAFAAYFGKSPERLGKEEVRRYLLYLIDDQHQSEGSVNVAYWALRFVYDNVLGKQGLLDDVSHPKDTKKLPVILNQQEVKQFFDSAVKILDFVYIERISQAEHGDSVSDRGKAFCRGRPHSLCR